MDGGLKAAAPELSIRSVLSRTLRTLEKARVVFYGLSVVSLLPFMAAGALQQTLEPTMTIGEGIGVWAVYGLSAVFSAFVDGAICHAALRTVQGNKASFSGSVAFAITHFRSLLLVSLLTGLGIFAGTCLLIIPGLILACYWMVAIPACVTEELGARASIRRSTELTRGNRKKVFAFMVAFFVLAVLLGVVQNAVAEILGLNILLEELLYLLLQLVPQTFYSVAVFIMYSDLRGGREGVFLTHLGQVFD